MCTFFLLIRASLLTKARLITGDCTNVDLTSVTYSMKIISEMMVWKRASIYTISTVQEPVVPALNDCNSLSAGCGEQAVWDIG